MCSLWVANICQRCMRKSNRISHNSIVSIFLCNIYHPWINITSIYLIRFLKYFCFCFLYHFIMKLLRAPRKLQIIISSSKSWGNISRYHSCLYQYCTTSTHRIIERSFVFPAAQKNHRSSQRLLDRCLSCLTTISSLMECRTRSIDENMYFISHHKNTYFKRLMKHIFMPFIRSLRESANNCFLCDGLNCRSM